MIIDDANITDERSLAIEQIVRSLPRIMGALFTDKLMAEAEELTFPQIRTLSAIHRHPDCTMSDLAQCLGVTLPSATQVVDRLVRRGLVERAADGDDRRVVRVRLTPSGIEVKREAWRERNRQLQNASRYLSSEELSAIADALGRLLTAVRRSKEEQSGDRS